MIVYTCNLITEKKMDGYGTVMQNGRVLNKYPICVAYNGDIFDYNEFIKGVYDNYLTGLDEDTISRTYMYLRKNQGKGWESEKINVSTLIDLIKKTQQ